MGGARKIQGAVHVRGHRPGAQKAQTLRPGQDVLEATPGLGVEIWGNERLQVL